MRAPGGGFLKNRATDEFRKSEANERKTDDETWPGESNAKLLALIQAIPDMVFFKDVRGRHVLVNKAVEEFIGMKQEDIAGKTIEDLKVPPEMSESCRRSDEEVMRSRLALHCEDQYPGKAGEVRCFDTLKAPIVDSEGSVIGMVGVSRDITERKRAEEELANAIFKANKERDKTEAVINAIDYGISVQDTDYKVLFQNPSHKSLVGDHAGEYCYKAYKGRDSVCEGCLLAKSFEDGLVHTEVRGGPAGKRDLSIEITTSPLKDPSGKLIGGIELVRDVSARMRTAEELEKYRNQLEELVKQRTRELAGLNDQLLQSQKMEAIGQLAGGIAHDFNNILSGIMGHVALIGMKVKDNSALKANLDMIRELSNRAAHLTKSLLAFSRKQPVDLKPMDINGIIHGFQKILSRLIGEDIELKVSLPSGGLIAKVDRGQMEQVLMNLAANARDAMPLGGSLTISTGLIEMDGNFLKVHDFGKAGTYAVISVEDTGSGMDGDTREHIFEPFFTTKEVGKGTGLGLAVVYGIITQHNGYIEVHSEPGKGTTFMIYLPLIAPDAGACEGGEDASTPLSGFETILLVEDDKAVLWVTKAMLEEFGYKVIEAVDGEDAVRTFMEHRDDVQLIITDVIMPRRNGMSALDEIRSIRPGVRSILISGYPAEIINGRGLQAEGMNFVSKPIDPEGLLRRVREVLDS
ncbi:MAG TPA: PAS domain S-box protein [Dissulfurispiraceae bacterium]